MHVQISHRSLASLELVDAANTGKQVACPVCLSGLPCVLLIPCALA